MGIKQIAIHREKKKKDSDIAIEVNKIGRVFNVPPNQHFNCFVFSSSLKLKQYVTEGS